MKFGKLPLENLDKIDLSLPEDHPQTKVTLKQASPVIAPRVYVGCAKWGRKEWVDFLYPKGTSDKQFLDEYVKHFNAIEMNTTFYSIKKENVKKWAAKAPDGFKFSPKFNRSITHIKRLNEDSQRYTDYFIDCTLAFEDKLGYSFLQLPENYTGKYLDRLDEYLSKLPADFPLCVEFRHAGWFSDSKLFDETFEVLASHHVGAVITDVAGRRDVLHQRLTIPAAFIRFNGYGLHDSDYKRLDEWADRINIWINLGLHEVYFYVHQENEKHTPIIADYFIEQINKRQPLNLPRLQFI